MRFVYLPLASVYSGVVSMQYFDENSLSNAATPFNGSFGMPPCVQLPSSSSALTKTQWFKRLTRWAFGICDSDGTGRVGRTELYAGILLVHLQLAKYAGAAACYPPSREVIDGLYDASDDDKSGTIDLKEFEKIMVVCCAQILSRIFVYFLIIILLVPYVASAVAALLLNVDNWFELGFQAQAGSFAWMETILTFGQFAEKTISCALFFLVIPILFDYIDESSNVSAQNLVVDQAEDGEKTD